MKIVSPHTSAIVGTRDMGRCVYCDVLTTHKKDQPNTRTLDHIIPQSAGGSSDEDNVCVACWQCNNNKDSEYPGPWIVSQSWNPNKKIQALVRLARITSRRTSFLWPEWERKENTTTMAQWCGRVTSALKAETAARVVSVKEVAGQSAATEPSAVSALSFRGHAGRWVVINRTNGCVLGAVVLRDGLRWAHAVSLGRSNPFGDVIGAYSHRGKAALFLHYRDRSGE